jgi:hypothetical protein
MRRTPPPPTGVKAGVGRARRTHQSLAGSHGGPASSTLRADQVEVTGRVAPQRSIAARNAHAPLGRFPRDVRRTVELTEEQITVLKAALDCWERAIRDTSYDPQVEEWARTPRAIPSGSLRPYEMR